MLYLNEINNLTVCQNESLITNSNATYNCCIYNYEIEECEKRMSTTIITILNEESTLIKPQSTINTIFTHENKISSSIIFMNTELMSTFFSQHFENQNTNKESTETINLTSENRINFDSTLLEGKQESTTNHFLDTTYVSEIRDKTSNIDTNQINIPTNNPLNETTSIKKESTSIIFKTYS